MSRIAILAIWAYQKTFSPILYLLGVRCRFYPTCSAYAIFAFGENGFRRGLSLTYRRLRRCRPDNFESCIDFPLSRSHRSPFFSSGSMRTKYEHSHPASTLLWAPSEANLYCARRSICLKSIFASS